MEDMPMANAQATAAQATAASDTPKVIGKISFLMPDVQDKKHSVRYFANGNKAEDGKAPAFGTVYIDKLALAERGIPLGKVVRVTLEVFENDAALKPEKAIAGQ
jgi:hypothetical protein